jgi:hypothetical protein
MCPSDDPEARIVFPRREPDGTVTFEQKSLNVPLALARGRYEDLTTKQINEHMNDLRAELARREEDGK